MISAQTASLTQWQAILEGLNEAVWLVGGERFDLLAMNARAATLLGVDRDQVLGKTATSLIDSLEDAAFWEAAAAGRPSSIHSHVLVSRQDGHLVYALRRISMLDSAGENGYALYMVSLQDLTEQRRVEEERETALAELRATLESTADGILVVDPSGHIRAFNRRFASIWKLPEELLMQSDDQAVLAWMRNEVVDAEAYQRRLDGIEQEALVHAVDRIELRSGRVIERTSQPQWSGGRRIGRVHAFRDLSREIAADRRIEALSLCDPLTGLPNRRCFADHVSRAMALSRRQGGAFALLVLDLDRFKQVNDSLGHAQGDQVLRDVSERLKACLREADIVARLGGDQFGLLVHHAEVQGAEATARRVLIAVGRPFTLEGSQFTVTCSVGLALFPRDAAAPDELMRHAETAMQRAKEGGRSGYRFHKMQKKVDLRLRMRLDHSMRQALAGDGFRLHFQPQVDLSNGRVVGAEALLRWRDADLGEIPPSDFIPVAEESGFIVLIGEWVLARAVQQAAAWHARGLQLPVAINVSALQFRQHSFVERVGAALAEAGLPPQLLELELTESILVHDADEALHRLQSLAQIGVRMAIDDFGTGYSSLAYLKRFPLQRLKIDRRFVQGLPRDDSDAGIVRAIIQMARALRLTVIAEGVETEAQREFLAKAGCDMFQGFLKAPALDTVSFERQVLRVRVPELPIRTRLIAPRPIAGRAG